MYKWNEFLKGCSEQWSTQRPKTLVGQTAGFFMKRAEKEIGDGFMEIAAKAYKIYKKSKK